MTKALVINNQLWGYVEPADLIETLVELIQTDVYNPRRDEIKIINTPSLEFNTKSRSKP